jgi:glucose-6-phosphate dehydrogenase assembly protein OpcA
VAPVSNTLSDTSAADIDRALVDARRAHGGPTAGHVLTLLVAAESHEHNAAIQATTTTAVEHPSRILVLRKHPGSGPGRLDAEVFGSGDRGPGELVILDLHGELAEHTESVVMPLLLPDTPVVTYWPGVGPDDPARDPLGRLSQRRITDLAGCGDPTGTLQRRAAHYVEGDTDLAWTRLTLWRTLLATALDQYTGRPTGARVAAEAGNASAELLAIWLESRLGVGVDREVSAGPGLTDVVLMLGTDEVAVSRTDGRLATLRSPGHSTPQPIALKRRDLAELMGEELRQLNPDDIYGDCLAALASRNAEGSGS